MRRYFVIETPEQLKAISDPLRIRLLTTIVTKEATGKQLADELQMSASKVHYHLHELENHGFAEVVRTEEKNGIVQKFYRAVAIDYVLSESLLPSGQWDASMLQEVMANQLRLALKRVYETSEEFFQAPVSEKGNQLPVIHGVWEVRAEPSKLLAWKKKFHALMAELNALDETANSLPESVSLTDKPASKEVFFMTTIGFLTDIEGFQVDEPGFPGGYELSVHPATGEVTARRGGQSDDTRGE